MAASPDRLGKPPAWRPGLRLQTSLSGNLRTSSAQSAEGSVIQAGRRIDIGPCRPTLIEFMFDQAFRWFCRLVPPERPETGPANMLEGTAPPCATTLSPTRPPKYGLKRPSKKIASMPHGGCKPAKYRARTVHRPHWRPSVTDAFNIIGVTATTMGEQRQ